MKKEVLGIDDLREMSSFFQNPMGTAIGKRFLKWFKVDAVNKLHERHGDLRGAEFTHAILSDPVINLKYRIHNSQVLDNLPKGSFTTVSNHPIGSLDGIILIDTFASRRPDFKVMVNGFISKISAMNDNFISVKPDSKKTNVTDPKNINGLRESISHIEEGHPLGFFPAGAMSFYNKKFKQVRDLPWTHGVIRLIQKADVPVIPVFFDFLNSKFFYWLGRINWQIRQLRVPAEVFNKKGRTVDVYIGNPIFAEELEKFDDPTALGQFLYDKTYNLKATIND